MFSSSQPHRCINLLFTEPFFALRYVIRIARKVTATCNHAHLGTRSMLLLGHPSECFLRPSLLRSYLRRVPQPQALSYQLVLTHTDSHAQIESSTIYASIQRTGKRQACFYLHIIILPPDFMLHCKLLNFSCNSLLVPALCLAAVLWRQS